ncbi:MAG TPA: acetyl-CoA carboxylase carboxyl transferase subunit alpha, partial [Fibrobacteres bacterium]|nr:acetyl-CoA carboxylase carboxyl transferase subunit alpha [Fibrobacterota bacterium]
MDDYFEFEKPVAEIEKTIEKLKNISPEKGNMADEINELEKKCRILREDIYSHLTPWQMVQIARHPKRPVLQDYISMIFSDFVELHGDRRFSEDEALIGGFARLGETKVMLIGHNKGKNLEQNVKRNFAQPRPEGYRKALRLMKLAEKYDLPIISFVDTQGAFPGLDGEERGVAEAIARNLTEMARIEVPVIVVITGEGGSGGALGIAVGDSVLMLSYAVYSVISAEGCASILWRDASYASQAASALKITAPSQLELGVIDEIIKEPLGGAHRNPENAAS